jgi:ABC-type nickel/cobalt efflux system permease component RcnA
MRRGVSLAALAVALGLAALWAFGGFEALADRALAAQREMQGQLAAALRGLRAGHPGALAGLIGLGFLYGLLHAAGPGHGKVLIGAWGLARPVGLPRLMAVSLAASLLQAAWAVALVYAGGLVLGWSRERLSGLAEGALSQAGTAAILLIGLWLALRGLRGSRGLWRAGGAAAALSGDHGHAHRHDHAPGGHALGHGHAHRPGGADACGHRHLPDPDAIARATGPVETLALIGAVAVRPCTGALFLLVVTWQMGLAGAGIAATFAMGVGTFATVALAAALARLLREGAAEAMAGSRALVLGLPLIELAAGSAIALTSAAILLRA